MKTRYQSKHREIQNVQNTTLSSITNRHEALLRSSFLMFFEKYNKTNNKTNSNVQTHILK